MQRDLIELLCEFVELRGQFAAKKFVSIIKGLYDNDYLEEELIVQWHAEESAEGSFVAQLRLLLSPFVKWLAEAEEEESDEED